MRKLTDAAYKYHKDRYEYLEHHCAVSDFGLGKNIEAEWPALILLIGIVPVEGGDPYLEGKELLATTLELLIAVFNCVVFMPFVVGVH